ncbi:MAG: hypothetical protein ACOY3P_14925 [Planctomycetota bacterium]
MSEPSVSLHFDATRRYQPGDVLAGEYRVEGIHPSQVKAVEVSVLWFTDGKGEPDMAVHEFWRFHPEEGERLDRPRAGSYQTTLPLSPLSYEGAILQIRWCVRARVFLHRAKELFAERVFRLGCVPPPDAGPACPLPGDGAASAGESRGSVVELRASSGNGR